MSHGRRYGVMNVNQIKIAVIGTVLSLSQFAIAGNELSLPLANEIESLTIEQIKQQPRYSILIQNNMCLGKYNCQDKTTYPVLNSQYVWFFGNPYFENNAEMYLIRGLHVSNEEIIHKGLKDYPEFKEHFQIFRTKCYITREKVDVALFNFWKADKLGSSLARELLEMYRNRVGDEMYYRYINLFESQSTGKHKVN